MAFDKLVDSVKLDGAITATANAIREKAETTEKIAWNPDTGFADAISAITVDPTKVTILSKQTFTGFVVDPTFGAYSPGYVSPALFQLENGKTYHVEWDGTEYECVAYSYSYGGSTIVAIGNGGSLGLPSNNEPFLISYNATYDNSQLFSTEAKDSHTVGIWQKATGGSSDDVRYVTFMSEDGTVELGKKAVATGDDCADPIARGVFSTPTKESTAQYNYTFYGWATTPNGAADSNWNKSVTEDRTVYANFASVVRYYTITYYDSDGATVLKTESLAYGAMPSYKPSRENIVFSNWNPAPTPVTGDSSYTAVWEEKITFASASWAKIGEIAASGQAAEYFSVGDEKTFSLAGGTGKTFVCTIAGFNHDTLANNSGKAPITIVVKNVWGLQIAGLNNITNSMANAYNYSNLNNTLAEQILYYMPAELKSRIKPVSKQCLNTSSSDIINNNYSIFALSQKELGNTVGSLGSTYEYFKTDSINRRKMPLYGESTYQPYWIRDQYNFNNYMSFVDSTGQIVTKSLATSTRYHVHFGFCI